MSNITAAGAGADNVTWNENVVALLLPSFANTSSIESVGRSSFLIVPIPSPSVTFAPATLVAFTRKVSSGSTLLSPLIVTLKLYVVWPAGMI